MKLAGKVHGGHNELELTVVDIVDELPEDPVEGQLAWFSPGDKLYIYDGDNWKEFALHLPGSSPTTMVNLHLTGWLDVDGLTQLQELEVFSDVYLHREIRIHDNIITLNYDESAMGVAQYGSKSGIEVDRGLYPMVSLLYDESIDRWTLTHDGITFSIISTNDDDDTFLRLDNGSHPIADISWDNRKITDLHDPSDDQDAVNLRYLTDKLNELKTELENEINNIDLSEYLRRDGTNSPLADIDWNNNKITNLNTPTSDYEAANKKYVDDQISSLDVSSTYLRRDGGNYPTNNISWNNKRITNLSTPIDDNDAVNKKYVDDKTNITPGLPDPDYDSGWVYTNGAYDTTVEFRHDLGDIPKLVVVYVKAGSDYSLEYPNEVKLLASTMGYIGGARDRSGVINGIGDTFIHIHYHRGLWAGSMTRRAGGGEHQEYMKDGYIRVYAWK